MAKFSVKLLSILASISLVKSAQIYSCTVPNTVALTFDDGPTQYTSALIDTLDKYNIKATFFINAHNYYPYADESSAARAVIKKAYQSGHQIASHTYNHVIESNTSEFKKSLSKMDTFVKNIIGVTPRYFRAPGGNCGDSCINFLENLGYRIIKWDVDTIDWQSRSFSSSSSIIKDFAKQKSKNYLILMHDSIEHSVKETVPWILSSGIFSNYKFVTVAECLGEKSKMYRETSSSSSSSSSNSNSSSNKQVTTVAAKATLTKQRTVTKAKAAAYTNTADANPAVDNSSVTNSAIANPAVDNSSVTNSAIANSVEANTVETNPGLANSGLVDPTLNSTNVPEAYGMETNNPDVSLTANTSKPEDYSGSMRSSIPSVLMILAISAFLVFNGSL